MRAVKSIKFIKSIRSMDPCGARKIKVKREKLKMRRFSDYEKRVL